MKITIECGLFRYFVSLRDGGHEEKLSLPRMTLWPEHQPEHHSLAQLAFETAVLVERYRSFLSKPPQPASDETVPHGSSHLFVSRATSDLQR